MRRSCTCWKRPAGRTGMAAPRSATRSNLRPDISRRPDVPIIDLQRRLREIGRIRIGQQVPITNPKPGSKAKTRPVKLETFRLTSRDQRVIDAAAALYG